MEIIKLGAGVTRRALRAVLLFAYSGALATPTFFFGHDGDGDSDSARSAESRAEVAKLASKCGAYELAHCARFRRPKPGARVRRLTEALEALAKRETRADVFFHPDGAEIPENPLESVFPAHKIVLCARAEYFRAALDPARGFIESGALATGKGKRTGDAKQNGRETCVSFPAATRDALAAALRCLYAGATPRVDATLTTSAKKDSDDLKTSSPFTVTATTAVHLAATLEYLMLDLEAEACASRVAFAARADDWRERLGGVAGALEALAAAANERRWAELDALLGAVAAVYPEAAETEPDLFEAIHPDLREAMRRAHVQQTRAR